MLENFVFDKNTFVNPEKPFTRCSCYLMNAYEGLYVKLRKREGVV